MTTHIEVEMEMKGWDEKPYHEMENGIKMTQALIPVAYSGGIEGEGMLQYLLCYRPDGTGVFMGYERFTGRIGDRTGSFAWKHDGIFQPNGVKTTLTIIPGTGTGDLKGIRGEGRFIALHGLKHHLSMEYEFVDDPVSWEVDIEGTDGTPQTKAALLERMAHSRAQFQGLIGSLTEAQMTQPGPDRWSVKDHLLHLAAWEKGIAALLRREPRWEAMGVTAEEVAQNDENGINALIELRNKGMSLHDVREKFEAAHRHLAEAIGPLSDEDLEKPANAYDPKASDMPVKLLIIGNTYGHWEEHAGWIRELLAESQNA